MYKLLLSDHTSGFYNHKWILHIKNILQDSGRNDLWLAQEIGNVTSVKGQIQRILQDQYRQKWTSKLLGSNKGTNYQNIKNNNISQEHYLSKYPKQVYTPILKFRTSNHKLPIETGRWAKIPHNERKCLKCNNGSLGDEFHYLLECDFFKTLREGAIKKYYYTLDQI